MPERRKKIAVVGSGIAGLTVGYLLSDDHDVTIFETAKTFGMDAHSVDVRGARIDAPLRVFSASYYPKLTALYSLVGVKYSPASYAFSCSESSGPAYFRFVNYLFGSNAVPFLGLLGLPALSLRYAKLVWEFLRFMRQSPKDLEKRPEQLRAMTFGEYLKDEGYSQAFILDLLAPMYCVICTCTAAAVLAYPADICVNYLADRHGLSSCHLRAYNGTREVVDKLSRKFKDCRVSTRVTNIRPVKQTITDTEGPRTELTFQGPNGEVGIEMFDEVVIATQANTAARLLPADNVKLAEVRAALQGFGYEKSRVVVHTDSKVMPGRRLDWSPLNLVVTDDRSKVACNVWMNRIDTRLRKQLTGDVFQTWNPLIEPEKAKVIMDGWFERPVVTQGSALAMGALHRLQGTQGIWFVGAYSLYSMPLLENGVRSAIKVAHKLGVRNEHLTWTDKDDLVEEGLVLQGSDLFSKDKKASNKKGRGSSGIKWLVLLGAATAGALTYRKVKAA